MAEIDPIKIEAVYIPETIDNTKIDRVAVYQQSSARRNERNSYFYSQNENNNQSSSSDKEYRCIECDKIFPNADQLGQHLVFHNIERPFACTQCSLAFIRKYVLDKHSLTHLGNTGGRFACRNCQRRFHTKTELEHHSLTHIRVICKYLSE